jgi:hypothetical protein
MDMYGQPTLTDKSGLKGYSAFIRVYPRPISRIVTGAKFGVRVWPEILPTLGVDPASLKPGPNPVNLKVNVLMGENGPRKLISLAR